MLEGAGFRGLKMSKLLEQALGLLFVLVLLITLLLRLPAAYAHAGSYRIRRALLRRAMPPDITSPQSLLGAVATDQRVSPGLRSLVALEQARFGDLNGARKSIDTAERDVTRLLRSRLTFLNHGVDPHFELQTLLRSRRRLAAMDLPEPLNLEHQSAILARIMLSASADVVAATERGDFRHALNLALLEEADTISLQPVRSLALIATRQHERGDPDAPETLRRASPLAAGLSNWWPIGDDSGYRERALALVAVQQAHIADTDGALETLRRILDPDAADATAKDIAVVLASRGDVGATVAVLWSIADHDQRARACIDAVQVWPTPAAGGKVPD